ncbi:acetyl-CoA carboxylase biotin carboxyl carrier protein subunit [Ammoniphilus sp. 3BR4]|uniref:acetyl-CoA carboxylase biotin carboxyl carrier protein n=1 Tax=Ammoniphilus sp. 3BR4 TaxID=3158265 RepID=UPI00346743C7
MIKLHEIRELIRLVDQSSIDELELENGGMLITLKKSQPVAEPLALEELTEAKADEETAYYEAATAAEVLVNGQETETEPSAVEPTAETARLHEVISPWVGVFTNPSVKTGERVEPGQVVCHCNVEPLKLFHDIKSSVAGEVVEILAEEGQLIEYGQPLFVVKAD